jgi:hypothetical protein
MKTQMRYLSFVVVLFFVLPAFVPHMSEAAATGTGMVQDLTVTPCFVNAGSYVTSISCSLGKVPAGDTIRCTSEYGDSGPAARFSDNVNGVYLVASYGVTGEGGYHEFLGKWYFPNSAAGTLTVTESFNISVDASGFSCAAFKGGATTNALDPNFFGWNDTGDQLTSVTLPSSPTPISAGELIDCGMSTGTNASKHAASGNSNYVMTDADAVDALYPMAWAQSTATAANCPYTVSPADSSTILGNAFLPAGATGGITPYQAFIETFAGLTNNSAPQAEPLIAGASGNAPGWFGAELDWYQGGVFSITNTHSDLAGSTAGPTNLFSSKLYLPAVNTVTDCCVYTSYQTYNGNSPMNLRLTTGNSGDGVGVRVLEPQNSLSWGYYLQWDIPSNDLSSHKYVLGGAKATGDQLLTALVPTGAEMNVSMVGGPGATTVALGIGSPNTAYWVTGQFIQGGTLSMAMYKGCPTPSNPTQACTLVGSKTIADTGTNPVTSFLIGSNNGTQASGDHIYWRNVKWCASYPCMP